MKVCYIAGYIHFQQFIFIHNFYFSNRYEKSYIHIKHNSLCDVMAKMKKIKLYRIKNESETRLIRNSMNLPLKFIFIAKNTNKN